MKWEIKEVLYFFEEPLIFVTTTLDLVYQFAPNQFLIVPTSEEIVGRLKRKEITLREAMSVNGVDLQDLVPNIAIYT